VLKLQKNIYYELHRFWWVSRGGEIFYFTHEEELVCKGVRTHGGLTAPLSSCLRFLDGSPEMSGGVCDRGRYLSRSAGDAEDL